MKPTRKLSRRSFVARVVGGAFAAASVTFAGKAAAFQVTDADSGPNADEYGHGRGGSGITDRDPTDPAHHGRGGGGGQISVNPQATTGSAGGAQTDPTNTGEYGRGAGGSTANPSATSGAERQPCTDSDYGSNADPGGHGRHC